MGRALLCEEIRVNRCSPYIFLFYSKYFAKFYSLYIDNTCSACYIIFIRQGKRHMTTPWSGAKTLIFDHRQRESLFMVSYTIEVKNEIHQVKEFVAKNGLPPFALDVLCNSDDCLLYEALFHGENIEATQDLMNFKKHKLATSTMTLDMFLIMCYNNKVKEAFEKTFMQTFDESRMTIIRRSLDTGRITLEEVYAKFEKNPNRNIMRYFKG